MGKGFFSLLKKKNNNNNEGREKKGDGENKEFMLNIDLPCEDFASNTFDGVETMKAETNANTLTVKGNVDPSKTQEKLHHKTNKTVDLISPQPKKDDDNNSSNGKKNFKQDEQKTEEKEALVTTAVLKLNLQCQCNGCVNKIQKHVKNFKGVHKTLPDKQKDLLTVKGTMNVKALVDSINVNLKKSVEFMAPKEEEKDGVDGDGQEGRSGTSAGPQKEEKDGRDGSVQKQGSGDAGNKMEHPIFGHGFNIKPGMSNTKVTFGTENRLEVEWNQGWNGMLNGMEWNEME